MSDHLQENHWQHQHQQQQKLDQPQLDLPPGFIFHPTDEEIITFYLIPKVIDLNFFTIAIGEVDLYKCEPWELPEKAKMGKHEWYFYCKKERKYPIGMRTNRATIAGYWKATGKDKEICVPQSSVLVGMKKTLVFYKGRLPRGEKTNWVMYEYRIKTRKENVPCTTSSNVTTLISAATMDEWVVCRISHKSSGIKKVVMPSYAKAGMPISTGGAEQEQQQCFVVDSGNACMLPPLMDYATSSSMMASPPPHLHEASSYQLHEVDSDPSMIGGPRLPVMNGHTSGNQHHGMMMLPPPTPMSVSDQQMLMIKQGFMAGVGPSSSPSSIVSQQNTWTMLSNNDIDATAENLSVVMGMEDMWK